MSNFSNLDIQYYEHCDLTLHFTKILAIQPFLKKGNSTNVCWSRCFNKWNKQSLFWNLTNQKVLPEILMSSKVSNDPKVSSVWETCHMWFSWWSCLFLWIWVCSWGSSRFCPKSWIESCTASRQLRNPKIRGIFANFSFFCYHNFLNVCFFCFLLNFCFFVKITRGTRARSPPWICFFAKRSTPNAGPCFTDHTHTLVASSTDFLRVFQAAFSNQNQAARWPSWASKALPSRRVWPIMRFLVVSFKG